VRAARADEWPRWAERRRVDIVGRRPVILAGIVGVAVTTLFLGFSQSLIGILAARFLGAPPPTSLFVPPPTHVCLFAAGLAAGNAAVIHSVLGWRSGSRVYGGCKADADR
jgi:MFS family permease